MKQSDFSKRLQTIFFKLDQFIGMCNKDIRIQGGLPITRQEIKIVGQAALLLADLPFPVTSTMDLDTVSCLSHVVQEEFAHLLRQEGLHLETDGHLIWMPEDTKYKSIFEFNFVRVLVAEPDAVITSKYRFLRAKDKLLIATYLAHFPGTKTRFEKIKRSKKNAPRHRKSDPETQL